MREMKKDLLVLLRDRGKVLKVKTDLKSGGTHYEKTND